MATETTETVPELAGSAQEEDASERLRAAIGRLSRRLRPTVAGSGLTPSQTSILFTVVRQGPIGLSELAELESINPTMLSRITAQLVRGGPAGALRRPAGQARGVRARHGGRASHPRAHPPRAHARAERRTFSSSTARAGAAVAGAAGARGARRAARETGVGEAPRGRRPSHLRGAVDAQLPPLHRRAVGVADRHLDADGGAVVAGAEPHRLGHYARRDRRSADACRCCCSAHTAVSLPIASTSAG